VFSFVTISLLLRRWEMFHFYLLRLHSTVADVCHTLLAINTEYIPNTIKKLLFVVAMCEVLFEVRTIT
jgi:hypothetical protein